MRASLRELVAIRSSLVEELMQYLENMAKKAPVLPSHLKWGMGNRSFDLLYQPMLVQTDKSCLETQAGEYKSEGASSKAESGTSNQPPLPPFVLPAEQGKKRCIDWDTEGAQYHRLVILGEPGAGKSWLLSWEARRLAENSLGLLKNGRTDLKHLILPIFVPLDSLWDTAKTLKKNKNNRLAPENCLVLFAANGYSSEFASFLADRLRTEDCVLLLDAWNEVPPEHLTWLRNGLAAFARSCSGLRCSGPRIVVTSRNTTWLPGSSPLPDFQTGELCRFHPVEVERYAKVWFSEDPQKAGRFLTLIKERPSLKELSMSPLMLSIMCAVFDEDEEDFPISRGRMLHRCLRGFLKDWKEEKTCSPIETNEWAPTFLRSAQAALQLQVQGRLEFTEQDFQEAAGFILPNELVQANRFSSGLRQDGVITASAKGTGTLVTFSHQSFQEYLAATALAEKINVVNDWNSNVCLESDDKTIIQLVTEKVDDPEWTETITYLAGQIYYLEPLLKVLLPEPSEEKWLHRLCLAVRCVPELDESEERDKLQKAIVCRINEKLISMKVYGGYSEAELATVMHNLGSEIYKRDDFNGAAVCYTAAIALGFERAETLFNRALTYFRLERYPSALADIQHADQLSSELAPKDAADVKYVTGFTLRKLGRVDEAIPFQKDAIRLNPTYVNAYNELGFCYSELNKFKDAIEAYKKSIGLSPDNAWTHRQLGWCYRKLNKFKDAVEAYKKSVGLRPDDAWTHFHLGWCYSKRNRFKDAVQAYSKAAELSPEDPDYAINLSYCYTKLRMYDQAVEAARKAIQLKADESIAHGNLGEALYLLGQFDDAIESLQTSLRLEPNECSTHCVLGMCYDSLQRNDEAIREWREAVKLDPDGEYGKKARRLLKDAGALRPRR